MISRRRYMGSKKGLLPKGYTQLGWIESTGAQYIDTGIVSEQGVWEFHVVAAVGTAQVLFGAANGFNVSVTNGTYRATGQVVTDISPSSSRFDDIRLTVDTSTRQISLTVNGSQFSGTYSSAFGYGNNIGLFGFSNGRNLSSLKCETYEIKKDSVLMRQYIPCINPDNVVGMYDIIEGKFYSSPNRIAFIASNPV